MCITREYPPIAGLMHLYREAPAVDGGAEVARGQERISVRIPPGQANRAAAGELRVDVEVAAGADGHGLDRLVVELDRDRLRPVAVLAHERRGPDGAPDLLVGAMRERGVRHVHRQPVGVVAGLVPAAVELEPAGEAGEHSGLL